MAVQPFKVIQGHWSWSWS